MKCLLFGADGQLGLEQQRRNSEIEIETRGLYAADFTDPDACVAFVKATDAGMVINAMACTAVDMVDLALQINGATLTALADACLTAAKGFVADTDKAGTYHAPGVSWTGFAREIFAQTGLTPEVVDIPSSDYLTPAQLASGPVQSGRVGDLTRNQRDFCNDRS